MGIFETFDNDKPFERPSRVAQQVSCLAATNWCSDMPEAKNPGVSLPFTIAPNMAMSFHQAGDLSSGRNTQNRKFPANSIGYYRRIRGLSRKELAEGAGTSPQQIHRLETGERELDPEWAARLSHVLHVPAEDIGYSNSPNAYPWATRAVPVVAWLWPD